MTNFESLEAGEGVTPAIYYKTTISKLCARTCPSARFCGYPQQKRCYNDWIKWCKQEATNGKTK